MKTLILFPLAWLKSDKGFFERALSLLWFGAIGLAILCCGVLALASTADNSRDDELSSIRLQNTQTAIFFLTNSPTPSDTPTDTFTPSNTPTPSDTYTPSATPTETDTPKPTATRTPSPEPTTERLSQNIEDIEGSVYLRSSNLYQSTSGIVASFEVDVREGFNKESFADDLYQVAYQEAVTRYGSGNIAPFTFSAILWDGSGEAVAWDWDNDDDAWRTTELSITPAGNPMTITPTLLPSPVVEEINRVVYVTSEVVNIRACASTQCKILGTAKFGESIRVTGLYEDEWYRFVYNDADGWVSASLTSTTRPATSAPRPTSRPVTERPAATIPPVSSGSDCLCNQGNTLNCGDFSSQSSAQACFDKCMAETGRDVHGLDSGGVAGVACENN